MVFLEKLLAFYMFKKLLSITELLLPRKPVQETTLYYRITATMEACSRNYLVL